MSRIDYDEIVDGCAAAIAKREAEAHAASLENQRQAASQVAERAAADWTQNGSLGESNGRNQEKFNVPRDF
jgi:hypothetical protein